MICWHKWGKWKVVAVGRYGSAGIMPDIYQVRTGDMYEEQRRECEKCGKSQLRTAKA